jgi:hypothetical protein
VAEHVQFVKIERHGQYFASDAHEHNQIRDQQGRVAATPAVAGRKTINTHPLFPPAITSRSSATFRLSKRSIKYGSKNEPNRKLCGQGTYGTKDQNRVLFDIGKVERGP